MLPTVLVTGVSGYIGLYVAQQLLQAPNFVLHFMALFDRESKGMLDTNISADNTETLSLTNWVFTSLKESLTDSLLVVNTLIKKH